MVGKIVSTQCPACHWQWQPISSHRPLSQRFSYFLFVVNGKCELQDYLSLWVGLLSKNPARTSITWPTTKPDCSELLRAPPLRTLSRPNTGIAIIFYTTIPLLKSGAKFLFTLMS